MKMINEDRIELSVNAALTVPADRWLPDHRGAKIKKLANALAQCGEIGWLRVESLNPAGQASQLSTLNPAPAYGHPERRCPICGWIHDAAFTQINTGQTGNITIGGRLPDIVALVHRAHEHGLPGVGTKDAQLQKSCGGYRHPSKAFHDLKHRHDYKILFDTHKRGFLALRGAHVRTRNHS